MLNLTNSDSAADKIKLGYEKAIELWIYEGQLIWARFNAMLIENTIVVTIIGFFVTKDPTPYLVTCILSAAGIVLCMAWYIMMQRGFGYYKYWIFSARELEGKLTGLNTVSRGGNLAEGKPVLFEFDGRIHTLQIPY